MPRAALAPLPQYPFRASVKVRITDLNYGGHLGNDRMLALLHEARVAWLASHDWSELDCAGAALIMADAALLFQKEAFAGDVLDIEVAAGEPSRVGFRLFYRVTRPADGARVALAETGLVCFDYGTRRLLPLPDAVRAVCLARSAATGAEVGDAPGPAARSEGPAAGDARRRGGEAQ
ncbi:MAG: thioesterase family protein [Candidatus Krumholzibacteriia bacterium]